MQEQGAVARALAIGLRAPDDPQRKEVRRLAASECEIEILRAERQRERSFRDAYVGAV